MADLTSYEANGKVQSSEPSSGDVFAEPNTLFQGGVEAGSVVFREIKPKGGVEPSLVHTSRGLAVGDLDGDGALDLVVVNRDAAPYLLMNRTSRGNWIRFRVLTAGGRDAHGATVSATIGEVRSSRDVQPSASYLASSDPRVHFGLGEESQARNVTIRWPGEAEEAFGDFEAGAVYALRQGDGETVR